MPEIILQNHSYQYQITKKFVSRLTLRFVKNKILVTAPFLVPTSYILSFIKDHQSWILSHQTKFDFKKITILDKDYQLVIKKSARDSLVIFEDEQKIYLNSVSTSPASYLKIIDQKLRVHALKLINFYLKDLAQTYHFKYQRVSIRNQSTRFGSCSSVGNLSFNWQIVLLPFPLFRHVLLHELTHTIHHNHSAKFWVQLSLADPDYRTHNQLIKKHAPQYFISS